MMARARGQLAVAHGPQRPAQHRLIHADRELLLDPSHQILQPPTHHTINRRLRAILDKASQSSALLSVQFRPRPRMLGIDQPVRPAGVFEYRVRSSRWCFTHKFVLPPAARLVGEAIQYRQADGDTARARIVRTAKPGRLDDVLRQPGQAWNRVSVALQ